MCRKVWEKPLRKSSHNTYLFLIVLCNLIVNQNQLRIAPYRKEYYLKMIENLKADNNLETLMGYNNEIVEKARQMMIRNHLNVFKPKHKLENYTIDSELSKQ